MIAMIVGAVVDAAGVRWLITTASTPRSCCRRQLTGSTDGWCARGSIRVQRTAAEVVRAATLPDLRYGAGAPTQRETPTCTHCTQARPAASSTEGWSPLLPPGLV